jgi:hypothetical protein
VTDRSDWPAGQPTGNALDPDSPGRWDGSCTLGLVASRCAASSTRTSCAHKIMQTPRDEIEASLPAHRIVNADVTVMVKKRWNKTRRTGDKQGQLRLAHVEAPDVLQDDLGKVRQNYGGERPHLRSTTAIRDPTVSCRWLSRADVDLVTVTRPTS